MSPARGDRRVRRTREAIHRALISLMLEKGYDAVTASDIIERADVGRSTFYAHFTDKQHVLNSSLDDLATFLRSHADHSGQRLFGFSLPMFEHAHEQRRLLQALLGRRGSGAVQDRVQQLLADLVREDLVAHSRPEAWRTAGLEMVGTGVVGAYVALLARWLDEDEDRTPAELDAAFRRLVVPGVRAALRAANVPA